MITCKGTCGDFCCTEIVRTVTIEEAKRLTEIANERNLPITIEDGIWFGLRTHSDLPCTFYHAGKCTIYEDRPMVCRQYMCGDCGSLAERKRHARETFIRNRNRENGWHRFDPPNATDS